MPSRVRLFKDRRCLDGASVSAPGWAPVSTGSAPTWLRLTVQPTVLLPRAGRDCGALGGRKVRRMPWVAGHRSGVRYGLNSTPDGWTASVSI
jgi:hypothetical protein